MPIVSPSAQWIRETLPTHAFYVPGPVVNATTPPQTRMFIRVIVLLLSSSSVSSASTPVLLVLLRLMFLLRLLERVTLVLRNVLQDRRGTRPC